MINNLERALKYSGNLSGFVKEIHLKKLYDVFQQYYKVDTIQNPIDIYGEMIDSILMKYSKENKLNILDSIPILRDIVVSIIIDTDIQSYHEKIDNHISQIINEPDSFDTMFDNLFLKYLAAKYTMNYKELNDSQCKIIEQFVSISRFQGFKVMEQGSKGLKAPTFIHNEEHIILMLYFLGDSKVSLPIYSNILKMIEFDSKKGRYDTPKDWSKREFHKFSLHLYDKFKEYGTPNSPTDEEKKYFLWFLHDLNKTNDAFPSYTFDPNKIDTKDESNSWVQWQESRKYSRKFLKNKGIK